jgi:Uma2 family endonuclease
VLEVDAEAMPLVIEDWSKSAGDFDVDTKLSEYQAPGKREIWRRHPYQRKVTVWRRRSDGSYERSDQTHGIVGVAASPGAGIDLGALFADLDPGAGATPPV